MTPAELADLVLAAVRRAVESGDLAVTPPDSVVVERPRQKEHGDYATNVALQLAKQAGRPPRDVAAILQAALANEPALSSVDIAGPGFLNFRVSDAALGELARTVVTAGRAYGQTSAGQGQRVNLEFVSANPTGPMHVGHARWATVGDALANLLATTGYAVTREFYVNDAGAQIDKLAASLFARARQQAGDTAAEFPEDGYHGDYVTETAQAIVADNPGLLDQPEDKALAVFKEEGLARLLREVQQTLENFGVHFDVWFSERSLHEGGIARAIERFREQGHIYDADGAVWMRTTDFGDDKDRVLVRGDGAPTYFAADCAYYHDKRQRGFEKVIIQLGADHHGYIGRMRAMVSCYGDDPDQTFVILIGQMVNLTRQGEPVKMSKRAGTFVAFDDLIEATGNDAARYSLVRSSMDSTLDLDIDLITRHDPENPVFYVQYGHARIANLLRTASERGVPRGGSDEFRPELLTHEREVDLLGALGEWPRVVRSAAEMNAPHRVARYLEDLAGVFHRFYDACRVLPGPDDDPSLEEQALTKARLWLSEATKTVLSNGLELLGVSAPDRM